MLTRLQGIVVGALLLACGPVEAGAITGVGGGGGGAGAADPTPMFDFAPGIYDNGPAAIPPEVSTFTAMTREIDCDFRDHNTSLACDAGGTWTEVTGYGGGGGDVIPGYRAPWTDDAASASSFFRAVVRAPTTSVGDVATEDFIAIVEATVSTTGGAAQTIFGKYDSATPSGWSINVTAGNVARATVNGTSTAGYTLPRAQHNVYAVACKHDGSAGSLRFYVNHKMVASAVCPAATSTNAAHNAEIGGRSNSSSDQIDGRVSFAKMWRCPSGTPQCMTGTTATIDAVVLEMMDRAFGVWPVTATTPAPIVLVRESSASLEIVKATDTAANPRVMSFDIGPNWPRVGRTVEGVGRDYLPRVAGYYPEPAQSNLALRSRQFSLTWTKLNAGDTTQEDPFSSDANRTPADTLEADRLLAALDVVGVEHGWRQSITLEAGKMYNFSVWSAYGAGQRTVMWMRDATVANAVAWFDVEQCAVLQAGSGLHDPGSTNTRETASARTTKWGFNGGYTWCRTTIKVDGTAAAHNFDIGWSAAAGATTTTTSASETLGILHHAQVEAVESILIEGETESTAIVTTTATALRERDQLQYSHNNTPAAGMIECSFLLPANAMDNSTGGANSGLFLSLEVDANNYVVPEQTGEFQAPGWGFVYDIKSGGVAQIAAGGFSTRGHSLRDGQRHHLRAVYVTDDARLYVDGDTYSDVTDTSVTLPAFSAGGITIGYSETFDTEWTRGWIERCRLYSVETIPTYP